MYQINDLFRVGDSCGKLSTSKEEGLEGGAYKSHLPVIFCHITIFWFVIPSPNNTYFIFAVQDWHIPVTIWLFRTPNTGNSYHFLTYFWKITNLSGANSLYPLLLTVLAIHDVSDWTSSSWECMTKPEQARLYQDVKCHSSWCGRVGDWLQIDLGQEYTVNKIYTQGAKDSYGFVKVYTLSYWKSNGAWEDYRENGAVKVFFIN